MILLVMFKTMTQYYHLSHHSEILFYLAFLCCYFCLIVISIWLLCLNDLFNELQNRRFVSDRSIRNKKRISIQRIIHAYLHSETIAIKYIEIKNKFLIWAMCLPLQHFISFVDLLEDVGSRWVRRIMSASCPLPNV